jgi:hypothetical protein
VFLFISVATGSRDRVLQRDLNPTSVSGPDINDLISVSLVKGPITKESLRKEWTNLAEKIQKVEAQGRSISGRGDVELN